MHDAPGIVGFSTVEFHVLLLSFQVFVHIHSLLDMHTRGLLIATLLALRQHVVRALPTWPAPTDELEDLIYLNTGYRSTGFAGAVTPCSRGLSSSRVTAAEWLRTAFHDASA